MEKSPAFTLEFCLTLRNTRFIMFSIPNRKDNISTFIQWKIDEYWRFHV